MSRMTKIAKSRKIGGIKFGKGESAEVVNGPIITYFMSPEEIEARYGPPQVKARKAHGIEPKATQEEVEEAFARANSFGEAAKLFGIGTGGLRMLCRIYGIPLDDAIRRCKANEKTADPDSKTGAAESSTA